MKEEEMKKIIKKEALDYANRVDKEVYKRLTEMKETSLSSKILTYISDEERTGGFPEGILEVPKVKEAIKRLKEVIYYHTPHGSDKKILKKINEIFGEDLIK